MTSQVGAAAWSPEETKLQQICGLLASYHDPRADHRAVFRQLEESQKHLEFLLYLAFILGRADGAAAEVRMGAGLLLKNCVRRGGLRTGDTEVLGAVKGMLLAPLSHPLPAIRGTAGTVVSALVGAVGLRVWPEVVLGLCDCLRSDEPLRVLGGLDALRKVAEDHGGGLEEVVEGLPQRPVHLLVPPLLALLRSPAAEARQLALDCVYELTERISDLGPGALDGAVQGLFHLAMDTDAGVKRRVCRSLVQVLQLYPDRLEQHMASLIEYMLANTQSEDEEVALESCEFWTAFCVSHLDDSLIDMLRGALPQLVGVLMSNMVYGDADDDVIEAAEEEEAIARGVTLEDKDSEIRPSFGRASQSGDQSDKEEGDEGDYDESYRSWNLRKSSAQGIDSLSETYGDSLLPILLPIVEARVQEVDWKLRESALLALGAVSGGCIQGLRPYIGQMVGLMLPMTADAQPLVRSISCWALSRYSYELASGTKQSAEGAQLYDHAVQAVAERALDKNRKVQAAAMSAVAVFEDESGPELLAPKLPYLAGVLVQASATYGRKNLRLLYDALATLGERLAGTAQLQQPETAQKLLPPLLQRLHGLPEHDAEAQPLMICLASLVVSLGPGAGEFCGFLFQRCLQVLRVQAALRRSEAQALGVPPSPRADQPEHNAELESSALDLLAGVAEVLGPQTDALVAAHGEGLNELVAAACGDGHDGVRRSGFALLGELCRTCPGRVLSGAEGAPGGAAGVWGTLVVQCLRPQRLVTGSAVSAASNACWAVGELAAPLGCARLEPVVASLVDAIAPLLSRTSGFKRSMLENAAIAVGRLALVCPEPLAPHLGHFIWNWSAALAAVRDGLEKQHAFLGLCALIKGNPAAGLAGFAIVCEAFASWQEAPPEVARDTMALLGQFHVHLAAQGQWQGYWETVRPVMRSKLLATYTAVTGGTLPG